MVFTCPVRLGDGMKRTRRAVLGAGLGGAVLAGLGGCWPGGGKPDAKPSADPLAPILAGTLALIDQYQATIAGQPTLAGRLSPLLAECRAHAQALSTAMGHPIGSASASASAPVDPSASAAVPADPAAALAALKTAEQAGQARAVTACLAATPRTAILLGQLAASRACHLELLA
jgi:hypothetical protein